MKTLYKNGLIVSGSSADDFSTCMLVQDDRIAYTGHEAELQGSFDKVVDLQGRRVLPGLIDGHMHLLLFGSSLSKLSLESCTSLSTIRSTIAAYARANPHLPRLFCRGWMHSMTDGLALSSMLDDLDPRPIFIDSKDLHSAWCNSAALRELAVHDTPDPAGGVIHRDERGTPSGLLSEAAAVNIVWPHVARVASGGEKVGFVRNAVRAYNAAGYTGVVEMATDENLWETVWAFHREEEQKGEGKGGGMTLRMASHWIILPHADEAKVLEQVDRAIELHARYNLATSPGLRIAGIKVICDGVVDACTAALLRPYSSNGGNCSPLWDAAMLEKVVRRADEAGLQCALHAIGDATVKMAVDVLEKVGTKGRRHRIEHLEVTAAEDAKRLGELGITASVQPVHADPAIVRAWPKLLGKERCGRAFAYREFLDGGAKLAIGTDSPTAPHLPLRNLYTATTRRSAREPESVEVFNEHLALSLMEAVSAATAGSAYSCFADGYAGRLSEGMKADFVVVDMQWEADRLLDARVEETYFEGRRVYKRAE